jgi:Zn-dependent metalloprotease
MYKYILLSLLLSTVACQKSLNLKQVRWTANSKAKKPDLENINFKNTDSPVRIYGEIVERSQQKIGGTKIEGSFLQKIYNAKGDLQFLTGKYEVLSDSNLQKKAEDFDVAKYKALEVIKRKYLPLQKAAYVFAPEAIISLEEGVPKFHWLIDYISEDNTSVTSLRVSEDYAIEAIKNVGSCFQEKMSLVFPFGPKLSELKEELLRGLLGDGSLSNTKFMLTSNDGRAVKEENGAFSFTPEDDRFDHVQSYFFIQKTLDYAETFWNFNLAFPLRVQLRAGFPEKSNTSFYYKGQVRIGDGDGVSYQSIPRDPSILSHEVMHAIIESLSGMSTEGEAGSLNEGFADFLTAAIWDNPMLGHTAYKKGPYKRTVSNTITMAEKNGGLYHDSGILSGSFWEIRYALGSEKSQSLALKTITRLGAQPKFSDLKPAVIDAMNSLGWSIVDTARVEDILNNRGW